MAVFNREHLTRFQDVSASLFLLAAGTGSDPLIAGKANHTIYIRKISILITESAAQTVTIQDSATTPLVFASTVSSAAVGVKYDIDFGDDGVPATEGKDIDIAVSAAGVGATIAVEAYLKQTATCVPSQL